MGILDSPWAHVRLNQDDYLRYMDLLRPYEAKRAKKWIHKALNPIPIHLMQASLINAGFKILYWFDHPVSELEQKF